MKNPKIKKHKTIRIALTLDILTWARLNKLARMRGVSKSRLIRDILTERLSHPLPRVDCDLTRFVQKERARAAAYHDHVRASIERVASAAALRSPITRSVMKRDSERTEEARNDPPRNMDPAAGGTP